MKKKDKWEKGEMSRTIVLFCIRTMTIVLVWAILFKMVCAYLNIYVDISDILTFAGAFFGGELMLLAVKRIFAKEEKEDNKEVNGDGY